MRKKMFRIVEVSGEGCANCLSLHPILAALAKERGLELERVEASPQTAELLREWEIDRVPAVVLLSGDRRIAKCCGYQPEEILEVWLDAMIEQEENNGTE